MKVFIKVNFTKAYVIGLSCSMCLTECFNFYVHVYFSSVIIKLVWFLKYRETYLYFLPVTTGLFVSIGV